MYVTKYMVMLVIIWSMLLVGCSSASQETPAAPTSPPPTAVPTNTKLPPTATQVVNNLKLTIMNTEGQPIAGALASLDGETVAADETGSITFMGLSNTEAHVSVTASGYIPQELELTLQPGDNQSEVNLELDPAGLLSQNACTPDEKLLYLEDFQDGQAQGWDAIEAQAPGWSVGGDPDEPQNLAAIAQGITSIPWAWYDRENTRLNNVIWRIRVKYTGRVRAHLNFRLIEQPGGDSRYFYAIGPDGSTLVRRKNGEGVDLAGIETLTPGKWHLVEMGYFNGALTLFVDGEEKVTYTDPQPWTDGTINLEPYPEDDAVIYYDNLVLCELNAAPKALPRPKTGYDMTLILVNADGKPVNFGQATLIELGDLPSALQPIDEQGKVSWTDLPGETATVLVHAPGYKPFEQVIKLQQGQPGEFTLVLELDPFGLLPENACTMGEKLLYLEDFQDGKAQGWQNIMAAVELNAQNGWSIQPDETGNIVLMAANSSTGVADNLGDMKFDNAVWRLKVMVVGSDANGFLNWRHSFEQGDWRYYVPFGGTMQIGLNRFTNGQDITVAQSVAKMAQKKWYQFEISTYNGLTEVWLDGKKLLNYSDPQVLPPGTIGLELHLKDGAKMIFYFDNISVCELAAPFVSMPVP